MLSGPTGLDLAAMVDPNIRRSWMMSDRITFTNTTNGGSRYNDNVKSFFGTSAAVTSLYADGTDFIIQPKEVGSMRVRIGAATTDQGILYAYRIGLGDTVPVGGALCQFSTSSSTISTAFTGTLTHTGSTATMRTMIFTALHQGSAATNTALGALFTGATGNDNSGTKQSIGVQGVGGFNGSQTSSQGAVICRGVIAATPSVGGTHTGGTINSMNLFIQDDPVFVTAGATVQLAIGAQCAGTFQINDDRKAIFGGSTTVLGVNWLRWVSATSEMEAAIASTQVFKWSASVLTYADAYNLAVGSSTGTKIGTAITQKLGFYNAAPIAQRAGAAQVAVATTAAINVVPFGYATAAQADSIVTLVNELRAWAVAQGFIKGAA